MPVFVEDPAQFSKQRLKLELVAHNVPLPAGESKKQVYLDLYLKYIAKNKAADFSSDEEDQAQEDAVQEPSVSQEEEEQQNEESDKMDVTQLTDDELKAEFQKYGVKVGPIVASTRVLYERKLQRLLDPAPQPKQNGTSNADQYSDSEEEDDESGCECERPGPEPAAVTVTESDQSQLRDSRPVKDVLTEMFPDADRTPTGISATRRRPIKGAAGRPVQFKYPDLPMSPRTVEQQELQQRLVPLWVQVVVFLVVAVLLFLIYGAMEDSLANPFSALLDNLSQEAELIGESSSLPDSLAAPDAPPLPLTSEE
ncbi:LEM domain-containing protein 1 isoform X1 [Megalops cyprinoides]|uniref:LEM domain-containing protein 1 isoform X1 n=1 Tax=Megalops cyprinoides TaxID=118141 RepID=UPI001863A27E|nr:LEM domain-containing protein 1 isoform X1 [Megalops cyprinoides]